MDGDDDLDDLPFEVIQKLKDTVGLKRFKQLLKAQDERDTEDTMAKVKAKAAKVAREPRKNAHMAIRASKSSPLEVTSKMPPKKLRKVMLSAKPRARDPRFDDNAGTLNTDLFEKGFSFLDEKREAEEAQLKKEMRKPLKEEKKAELGRLLQRMQDQKKSQGKKKGDQKKRSERNKDEFALAKKGKKHFYLKKSVEKAVEVMEKYENLKSSGSMAKKMVSRRKRDASKAKRNLPNQ